MNVFRRRRNWGMTPTEHIVRHGDLTFRVVSSIRPNDAPRAAFVLVHGIGVSHRYFARLHADLATTDDVYSIDLPGFGGLPKPDRSLTVAEMAGALGGVLDELMLDRVVLVGHSMGAQWVVELAAQRPDLASHVVAVGPVADEKHRTLGAQALALAVDSLGEPLVGNFLVFTDYAFRCGPVWYLRQSPHMMSFRIEERVQDLTQPLLVMRGENDPIAGTEWCRQLRDNAAAGSLVVVPGCRHLVHHTAPRAVASALHTFVEASPLVAELAP